MTTTPLTPTRKLGTSIAEIHRAFANAAKSAGQSIAPFVRAMDVATGRISEVESLADFLLERDWPTTRTTPSRRIEYRRRAAAILSGDAAAIRQTWPEAAHEIATRSDWSA